MKRRLCGQTNYKRGIRNNNVLMREHSILESRDCKKCEDSPRAIWCRFYSYKNKEETVLAPNVSLNGNYIIMNGTLQYMVTGDH